jgi:hypothetical protein
MLEVHKMSALEPLDSPISKGDQSTGIEHCIERSSMMPVGREMTMEDYEIDGHKGILATVEGDLNNPLYILGWCLDEQDGTGSIISIVGSDLSWETTKGIFDSISSRWA